MTKKPKRPTRQRQPGLYVTLPPAATAALAEIKRRDGVPYNAQIARAVVLYAQQRGLEVKL